MSRRFAQVLGVLLLAATAGCASLKKALSEAVVMEYDQVNNFRGYEFVPGFSIPWGGGTEQNGIYGFSDDTDPNTNGFWATFVVCNLSNTGSKAQTFHYDAHNLYVEYEGKKHFYRPLDPYTYTSLPGGIAGNAAVTPLVNAQFHNETVLGEINDHFPKGYYPSLDYRVAIYVTKSQTGQVDVDAQLLLRYQGHPTLMLPRNQAPVVLSPGKAASLATACRPKGQ